MKQKKRSGGIGWLGLVLWRDKAFDKTKDTKVKKKIMVVPKDSK
ncbi:hypothetical protein AGMMS49556_08740 [Endomicrobiia bacterium]|nr:hypothetical protein AGMMS49556_08740 [Endomicrobiia bacterium]